MEAREKNLDIAAGLAQLFDNPPPADPLPESVPVADAWDADDDQFADDLVSRASLPAEDLSPVEIVGEKQWKQMVAEDPVFGGAAALDRVRTSWNWDMTPRQRARAVSDVAFGARIGALMDGFTKAAVKKFPDPFDYAAEVVAKRRM